MDEHRRLGAGELAARVNAQAVTVDTRVVRRVDADVVHGWLTEWRSTGLVEGDDTDGWALTDAGYAVASGLLEIEEELYGETEEETT